MPETKTATKRPRSASRNVWSDEERAAMQEGARERKSSAKVSPAEEREQGERDVQAKFADMPEPDQTMGRRIHQLVLAAAPHLAPKTYYGMPAYARDGKTICFFKPASKFKVRYATLGFQPDARLDDGAMWPTEFAVTRLAPADEERIADLVRRAAS